MIRKKLVKVLSVLLAASMLASSISVGSFAEEVIIEEEFADVDEQEVLLQEDVVQEDVDSEEYQEVVLIEDEDDFESVEEDVPLSVELTPEEEAAAAEVTSLINELPNPADVTLSDRAAITIASSKYDALSDAAKESIYKSLKTKLQQCIENLEKAEMTVAVQEVINLIQNLPDPSTVTVDDSPAIDNASKKFNALSVDAQAFIPDELYNKLMNCKTARDEDLTAREDAAEFSRDVKNAIKPADRITQDDRGTIVAYETKYENLSDKAKGYVDPEALQKLLDARNALNKLDAQQEAEQQIEDITQQIEDTIGNIEDLGDNYYDDQKTEIERLLAEIERLKQEAIEAIKNTTSDEERDEILAKLQEDINKILEQIAQVKTKDRVDADNYEQTLKSYKKPEDVTINDKTAIEGLRADYEALSDEAKGYVNTDYLKEGETYIARLTALERKIAELESALEAEKTAAKEALTQRELIRPDYYTESGINEDYHGIMDMVNSKKYDSQKEQELINILENALNKIDQTTDGSKIDGYKQDAIEAAKKVRDKERLQADAYEAKLDAYKKANDLSLKLDADDVKSLKDEYDKLPSYAKKYVDTNEITPGETYKDRLDSLVNRIDELATAEAQKFVSAIDALPSPQNATLANEAAIKSARQEYDGLAKEAKAKVPSEAVEKLKALEAKMTLEHQKEGATDGFNRFVNDKKANTTYYPNQLIEIENIKSETLAQIKNAKTYEEVLAAKNRGIARINAVKTKAQLLKAAGIKTNFNQMRFRSTKQTKTAIYLRWEGISGIQGFQVYGAKKGGQMKMLKQYDYKARSCRMTNLYEATEYKYKIYAFKVVDGEIIKTNASPVIYATTKGKTKSGAKTKYGTVTKVKVNKVGKKNTSSIRHTISVSLKKGKSAKIKAKEVKNNVKLKRRRKLKYESTNTKIATVSGSGKIVGRSKGTCWIRVYSQSGKYRSVKVKVK